MTATISLNEWVLELGDKTCICFRFCLLFDFNSKKKKITMELRVMKNQLCWKKMSTLQSMSYVINLKPTHVQ